MTRETKIGLLVGLAFIITIAVLLSDHLANVTVPKPAPLVDAMDDALKALTIPGGPSNNMLIPVLPENVVPVRSVATNADLNIAPPVSIVAVGPSGNQAPTEITQMQANDNLTRTTTTVIALDDPNASLVAIGDLGGSVLQTPLQTAPVPAADTSTHTLAAPVQKPMEYQAKPGDSVARMARQLLGGDTKSNRDLIIKANPGLAAAPEKIVVGKIYYIPVPAKAATVSAAAPPMAPHAVSSPPKPAAMPERSYVVKAGDNLWKIAREQCRDGRAVDEIRKLNRGVLKNGDNLKLGMKLRLPAR